MTVFDMFCLIGFAAFGVVIGWLWHDVRRMADGHYKSTERLVEASEAFAASMKCLREVASGVVSLENILIIKIPEGIFSKIPLSRAERKFLRKNPDLCDSPQELLDQMKKFGTPWVGSNHG